MSRLSDKSKILSMQNTMTEHKESDLSTHLLSLQMYGGKVEKNWFHNLISNPFCVRNSCFLLFIFLGNTLLYVVISDS